MDKRGELASSIVLVAFGIGYFIYATNYAWDSLANPGPGFLPCIIGALFTLLSIRLMLGALPRKSKQAWQEATATTEGKDRKSKMMPLLIVLILIIYILILEWAGYIPSTFLLIFTGIKVMGERTWLKPLLIATGLVVFTYFLFIVWLQVPLPQGKLIPIGGI
ncbi:tripartite tricarboxylate transporter TctB family protein [Neomoorella mulderi]|uniref:Tripartite tricarboxylate transporter TctB family protein n=1 Tax=Moorella mulderi DSM 14980 TaxID=1122241 RepID=A0A151AUL1_9FIRM|nr:tripartite tricarboxylate transporter TctB family protein [Moorella mulderi]KYH31291.1 tripartite tricarboxylate transporter TctB family protein [Moorella mulderi DSM 14980]